MSKTLIKDLAVWLIFTLIVATAFIAHAIFPWLEVVPFLTGAALMISIRAISEINHMRNGKWPSQRPA